MKTLGDFVFLELILVLLMCLSFVFAAVACAVILICRAIDYLKMQMFNATDVVVDTCRDVVLIGVMAVVLFLIARQLPWTLSLTIAATVVIVRVAFDLYTSDVRRACWTITLVSWAVYTLCPDSRRKEISDWMIEVGKAVRRRYYPTYEVRFIYKDRLAPYTGERVERVQTENVTCPGDAECYIRGRWDVIKILAIDLIV